MNEDIEVDESEWYGKCSCGGELCWTKASDVDFEKSLKQLLEKDWK